MTELRKCVKISASDNRKVIFRIHAYIAFGDETRSMESNDDERRTSRSNKWKRKATLPRVYSSMRKMLGRRKKTTTTPTPLTPRLGHFDANVCGITCNNSYALPKTTSDLCRQELMEKRLRASRFCCQSRRVQMAPSQAQQAPAGAATTSCPNCPSTRQTRGPALPNGGLTRALPCQALPPPPPCAPKCPPCPPCPPTLSTPLKASDYIHTTTECYPTDTQDDPCRWDNTTCYNEGNDASGNTIRQWNTRCQFAANSTGANCGGGGASGRPNASANNRVVAGSAAAGAGAGGSILGLGAVAGPTPASVIMNNGNNGGVGGADVAASDPTAADFNHRHHHRRTIGGRATNELSGCPHASCRSAVAAANALDHRFRKCKKELTIHFPSGKCGTQHQLRRNAKLGNLITPPRPGIAATTTTTARPDIAPTAAAFAAGFAARSRLPPPDAKGLLAESPMSTTRAPPLLATPLTPFSPAASASATSIRYYPQVSLIDDDMPPVSMASRPPQADTSIFTNRASQLRWLQNQRKFMPANKRSIIEPRTSSTSPPADFYKNDFDWARIKR